MNTTEVKMSVIALRRTIETLKNQLAVLNQQIAELEPTKTYLDIILDQEDDVLINQIAKDYGFNEDKLVKYLVGSCGFERVNLFCDKKYRLEIYYALKAKGILPLMEQSHGDDNA